MHCDMTAIAACQQWMDNTKHERLMRCRRIPRLRTPCISRAAGDHDPLAISALLLGLACARNLHQY
jgi:hypothetical protein